MVNIGENALRQLQIIQTQHTYVITSQKNKKKTKTFRSYPFKTFPAYEVRFSWNFQKRLKKISLYLYMICSVQSLNAM